MDKKDLSALGLLWISLTSMIGSGWLFGSLYSAHFAGPAAIIAWPLAGFLLLFVALSYAEVATMFPDGDTLTRLPLYTHGRLTSLLLNGLTWLTLATIPVIETQGLIQYANNYIPGLIIQQGVRYTSTTLGYLTAIVLLFSFVMLNYFGIRLFRRINAAFTIWKLIIPTLTIVLLLSVSYHEENFTQYGGFMPYGWQGVMTAMSSGGVLFSLVGFRQVVIMMNQIHNPGKYVPILLVSSILVTTILYTFLQWTFIGSLRGQDLAHGWSNLTFTGDAGPFAALAAITGLIWLSILLYTDAFISPYSTGLVYSTTAGQMLAGMGRMQDAPQQLADNNKYQAPWLSLLVNFLLALLMFLLLHNWQTMAAFLVATLMVTYAVGPITLICLRKQLPRYKRPFRLRGAGIIAFLGFYVCTAGVYWAGFDSIIKLLILTFIGLVLFLFFYMLKKRHDELDVKNSLWLIAYLIGLGVFSYYGNFGGKQLIPLYWDLVYLMGFCLVIFVLAIYSSKPAAHVQKLLGFNM